MISVEHRDNQTLLLTPQGERCGISYEHFESEHLQSEKKVTRIGEGRSSVFFFKQGNRELVLRHYYRGGLIAKLLKNTFLYDSLQQTRCFEELFILNLLRQHRLNVPNPIAALINRKTLTYSASIITEAIPETEELHSWLTRKPLPKELWQKIGIEIKKMHNLQVCHKDLNVKNVLIKQSSQVFLLDFDKCFKKSGNFWKKSNIARFKRSIEKQRGRHIKYHVSEGDWQHFMQAYER